MLSRVESSSNNKQNGKAALGPQPVLEKARAPEGAKVGKEPSGVTLELPNSAVLDELKQEIAALTIQGRWRAFKARRLHATNKQLISNVAGAGSAPAAEAQARDAASRTGPIEASASKPGKAAGA